MKKISLFILAALMSSLSWGQALLEDFNYATGALLTDNGWTVINGSSSVNAFTVNSSGLTYPNSPSNGVGFGVNMVAGGVSPQRVGRFVTAVTTGTAYMSFFVNVSAAGNSTTVGSNFAGMMNGPSPNPGASARVFIRSVAGGGFNFGVGKNSITPVANINYESTVRTFGTTYLIVLKYTYNSGTTTDDLVSLWINPTLGVAEPAATLTTVGLPVAAQTDGTSLSGPGFFQRDAASPTCQIDAVRYGTTWAFVTPLAVPTLTVNPSTPLTIATVPVNTNSPSVSFNLAGTFLTPAPGNISVASPNTDFQVSIDNVNFFSSVNIPHATSTLAATPVYVRFSSATAGGATVNLTISGGGVAAPPTVTVNAGAGTPFFSNAAGNLIDVSSWGTAANGTGTAPANFVDDYQIFTICNRSAYELTDNFQVFGIGSKIVIGNGTDPINLKLPENFTILNDIDHKVDVSNNATLEIANKIYRSSGPGDFSKTPFPYFGVMDNNSTVEYTWNGTDVTDTVRIPAETFGNLKLINGLKYFSSGFAFANGTLDITNVVGLNGTGNGSASILVRGNITLSNSFFDTDVFADANRINLNLGGSVTQTLSGGDFYVGQLRTQAVSPTVPAFALDIVLGANTNLITGTITGGGINLQQPLHNLSLNGKTLTMGNGSSFLSTNQGTISGTSTSNLIINKTVGTASIGTISFKAGGQVLNDFNFNSAGTGTNKLTLNSPLSINGTLTTTNGQLDLGAHNLTFKSTATTTARFAQTALATPFVYSGVGKVVVERYISNIGRKWRLLSARSTVTTQNIFDSWQESGGVVNNLGTWITAPGGGNGFDGSSNSASILKHNQATPAWVAVAATNTGSVNDEQGYMLFVRGDRNDNPGNASNAPTVLRTTGQLRVGTQAGVVVSATGSGRTLVGNPFASPVNMETIFTGTANLDQNMFVWDATLAGSYGVGGYRSVVRTGINTYDQTPVILGGTVINDPTIQFIHSGQAVFLKASGSDANVVFTENMKAVTPTTVYNPVVATPGDQQIIANLMVVNNAGSDALLTDGIRVRFNDSYQAAATDDIEKMGNFGENISSYRNGKKLIVEQRPMIEANDTIFLRITNAMVKDYRLQIGTIDFVQANVTAYLEDIYKGSKTVLSLNGVVNNVDFSITSDPASANQDRFRIVFAGGKSSPVIFTHVKAEQQDSNVLVAWEVSNQGDIKQYELERSTNGLNFTKVFTQAAIVNIAKYNWLDTKPSDVNNFYRIRSITNNGVEKISQVVNVKLIKGNSGISCNPNPAVNGIINLQFTDMEKGNYQLRLVSTEGRLMFTRNIYHNGSNTLQTLKPSGNIAAGNYILDIIKPNNSHIHTAVVIIN